MKQFCAFAGLAILVTLSGCGSNTSAESSKSNINCAVEVQIAVRSEPYKTGDTVNSGTYEVLSSNLFPIRSTGGRGHAISNTNGTIIEISWDSVRLLTYNAEQRIRFDDFSYVIRNEIQPPDGIRHRFGSSTKTMTLNTDFDWLQSPLAYAVKGQRRSQNRDNHRSLVIRGRLLTQTTDAKPLRISPLAGEKKNAQK